MITNIWMNRHRYNVEVLPSEDAINYNLVKEFIERNGLKEDAITALMDYPFWAVYYKLEETGTINPEIVVARQEHAAHNKACFTIYAMRNTL